MCTSGLKNCRTFTLAIWSIPQPEQAPTSQKTAMKARIMEMAIARHPPTQHQLDQHQSPCSLAKELMGSITVGGRNCHSKELS